MTVANSGTLTEAAQQIGRSVAAVSMTLSQIEHQIGGSLFDGERKSRLTPLGQYTLQQARRAVDEHQHALAEIERYASGAQGLSRIAVVPSAATRLLPPAIEQLARHFPGVQIDLRDIDSAAIHDAIHAGAVDFGIASKPDDDSLDSELLLSDPFRILCRADHPWAVLARDLKWRDLDGESFIANGLCRQIDNPELIRLMNASTLFIHNTLSLLAFLEAGLGVTLLPSLVRQQNDGLCALPIAGFDAQRELFILKRKNSSLSPLDLHLIDAIRIQASKY